MADAEQGLVDVGESEGVRSDEPLPRWLRDPVWLKELRRRHRDRLADRHPRVHGVVVGVESWFAGVTDRLVPRSRVDSLCILLASMVLLDSAATGLYLRKGLAVEGNPWVVAMMETYGTGVGLAVRAGWSLAVLLVIRIAALRDRRFRGVLMVSAGGLFAITAVHLAALAYIVVTGRI